MLADRGYYNRDEVLACEGTGIQPCIPKTQKSVNAKRGLFAVADFVYDPDNDRYTCPAGEHPSRGKVRSDRRQDIDHYRNLTACATCALKACMATTHLLTRTLEKVRLEMALSVLAYNLKRMVNIFGVRPLMNAITS